MRRLCPVPGYVHVRVLYLLPNPSAPAVSVVAAAVALQQSGEPADAEVPAVSEDESTSVQDAECVAATSEVATAEAVGDGYAARTDSNGCAAVGPDDRIVSEAVQ